jgi:PAS domain S-box-containing protein
MVINQRSGSGMDLSNYALSLLRAGDLMLYRGSSDVGPPALFVTAGNDSPVHVKRLQQEYGLRGELDAAWAARPVALTRCNGWLTLALEDPGGQLLDGLLVGPLEPSLFLRIAVRLANSVRRVHERGLIHKDIKPANILVDPRTGGAWITGFGLASRLLRERQGPDAPESIAGTLAYMAPEQTGRMNRSIDARSDLYSLGVTFYEMLTGVLPFDAADPLEWMHCHIARQPIQPHKRINTLPAQLSAIVMKLLAKTAEERYQTAAGVESDLRRCLAQWEARRRTEPFRLGAQDVSDRLAIPERIYGREHEIEVLLGAFDQVVANGTAQLVVVSGYSGIGKSSVVSELHKALVPPRGLFAAGKFDQYKRDIPYTTLGQCFQSLVRSLLGQSDSDLDRWRRDLGRALGSNAQLIVNLVPELGLIIGTQPPVPDLPPQDAKRRFQAVFRDFIGVFARKEHPLALFLDDLQWLDAATLDLLGDLMMSSDLRHAMLIGAYRDNEVGPDHPLMRTLEAIRRAGGAVLEIVLAPLSIDDLGRLLADSLHCESKSVAPLAALVHAKTAGNPFFAVQFISALAEEGLLNFEHGDARWSWDLNKMHAKDYSNNVADLMVGKLDRLPVESQKALQQLACLGNSAELEQLRIVCGASAEHVHGDFREAVRSGLVLPSEHRYRFLHDRIQEAAYSSIPDYQRGAAHLRIGRLLAAGTAPAEIEDKVFEIVIQLNRGCHLIQSAEERTRVAELNLLAGRRAKAAVAYASALGYFATGATLLAKDSWAEHYRLAFDLELNRAECEFLTGEVSLAEERLARLAPRAATLADRAAVISLQVSLYTNLGKVGSAVDVCLESLRLLAIEWPPHPTDAELRREYDHMRELLGGRPVASLIDLPAMLDSERRTLMDVMATLSVPAGLFDTNLNDLVVLRMANLSLEHGNSGASCTAYVDLSLVLGPRFGDYHTGYQFGQLSVDLVDKLGLERFRTRVYETFAAFAVPWLRHIRDGYTFGRRACEAGPKEGDVTFSSYAWWTRVTSLLGCGEPLSEVQLEAERGLAYANEAHFELSIELITAPLRLVRALRGLTPSLGTFNDHEFDETRYELHLQQNPSPHATPKYWTRKLQALFFAGEFASALAAAARAQSLLGATPPAFDLAEFHFYAALTHAALSVASSVDEISRHLDTIVSHHRELTRWAEGCPENFKDRAALVGAEIARLEGRELDAERLYEDAIRWARASGFVHNEGLAQETAARFYAARGFEAFSSTYLQNARACYLRWGADGKVRQMDQRHPHLTPRPTQLDRTVGVPGAQLDLIKAEKTSSDGGTILASNEQLDLATVIRVSEAVSGEIEQDKLIDTLMRTAIEYAGAERGILILPRADEYRIEAEAITGVDGLIVTLRQADITGADLPASVFQFVLRTRESVLLHDAATHSSFSTEEYIRQRGTRSMLCLPLLKQTRLLGVLYLENNLVGDVFTPTRMSVLKLLASAAAVSLENTRLYSDLREREARVRRLVDSNIIGIFIWDVDGLIIDANEAFLRIVGHDREDLLAGRLSWRELTPPEWREHDDRALAAVKITGIAAAYEKELFRKGGMRVPVLAGAAIFDRARNDGVAFMVDLSDRRRAEDAARDSDRRFHDIELQLEHANRVATVGQLSASIVHEVTQPITGVANNAQTALLCLRSGVPDLDRVRAALTRIVRDCGRASDVVGRIRALIRKAPPQKDLVHINDAIEDVVALTHAEVVKWSITCRTQLSPGLPVIALDRVQLQQVILNLIMNAVEAMSHIEVEDREIVIVTSSDAENIHVSVRDSGPGVDEANRERIFNAFYSTKPSGLGMGLQICRSIIEAHGGRLWASNAARRGAIFEFTLPVELPTSAVS